MWIFWLPRWPLPGVWLATCLLVGGDQWFPLDHVVFTSFLHLLNWLYLNLWVFFLLLFLCSPLSHCRVCVYEWVSSWVYAGLLAGIHSQQAHIFFFFCDIERPFLLSLLVSTVISQYQMRINVPKNLATLSGVILRKCEAAKYVLTSFLKLFEKKKYHVVPSVQLKYDPVKKNPSNQWQVLLPQSHSYHTDLISYKNLDKMCFQLRSRISCFRIIES